MQGIEARAARVSNAMGASPIVLVCDHASNRIPERYGDMGLDPAERVSHIAWDPGALELSFALSQKLDACLVYSTVSRLVIDPNRSPDAANAIWTLSEATAIAANENIDAAERQHRIESFHRPYHDAIETVLDARAAAGRPAILVCVHTFTPVYLGVARPWAVGVLHGSDPALSAAVRDALARFNPSLSIGWNEPYAALKGVTHTLEHHGDRRGLASTMIEVRNNEVLEPDGVALWTERLGAALLAGCDALHGRRQAGARANAAGGGAAIR